VSWILVAKIRCLVATILHVVVDNHIRWREPLAVTLLLDYGIFGKYKRLKFYLDDEVM